MEYENKKRKHVEKGDTPNKPPTKMSNQTGSLSHVKDLFGSRLSGEPPRDAQADAAIDDKNHAALPQEQPHAQPGSKAQPNAETVPAPTSLSEPSAIGEEEDKFPFTDTDLMWMRVALTVASRAEISEYAKEKPNVGCVIRRSRSKGPPAVLAVGWNGFPPKTSKDLLRDKAAWYDGKRRKHGLTKELALHAETNALRNCSENPEKATVYVTHVPCRDCAKQLVSHRVKRVFYLYWMNDYESSIKLFQDFDISCIPYPVSRRDDLLGVFKNNFARDHNISAGSTNLVIPKKGSSHVSTKDSTSGTSGFKRSVSCDYDDKVGKILQEIDEYKNRYNIKIVGVPEKSPEETVLETSDLCVSLFTEIGAKITILDIDMAQRTAKGRDSDGPRPIICKFVRRLARDSVMSVKQQARNVNPVKIGFSKDTDVSKISICRYDEDSQEMTEVASSTREHSLWHWCAVL